MGSFVVGNYLGLSGFYPQGVHTVEMQVYSNNASSVFRRAVDDRVYKG